MVLDTPTETNLATLQDALLIAHRTLEILEQHEDKDIAADSYANLIKVVNMLDNTDTLIRWAGYLAHRKDPKP